MKGAVLEAESLHLGTFASSPLMMSIRMMARDKKRGGEANATAETKIPQRAVAVVTDNQATSQRIWGLTRISIGSEGKGPNPFGRAARRGLLPEHEPHRPAGIPKTGDDRAWL